MAVLDFTTSSRIRCSACNRDAQSYCRPTMGFITAGGLSVCINCLADPLSKILNEYDIALLSELKPKTTRTPPKKLPIDKNIRWEVYKRDKFTCLSCGTQDILSIDHIIPESKGGLAAIENFQTLCKSCNSRKGRQDNDFRKKIQEEGKPALTE